MATMLLGGLVCALSGGCLILEDDVVYPDLPRKKNSPPRINLEASMSPPTREATIRVGGCEANDFHVSVDDDDVTDTLRSYWFVDPNQYYTSPSSYAKPAPGGTLVTRVLSAPVNVYNQISNLVSGQTHVVEVWVTDSDFEFTDTGLRVVQPTQLASDAGIDAGSASVLPTYYADSFGWRLTVVKCP